MNVDSFVDREAKYHFNEMMRESHRLAKPSTCILCGKPLSDICNSHTIPRCVLSVISESGKLSFPFLAAGVPFMGENRGLNNSWTFRFICKNCDNAYFSDYETAPVLYDPPTNIQMAEIALKNTLLRLSKRTIEVPYHSILQDRRHLYENKKELDLIQNLDIRDYLFDLRRYKKIIDKRLKSGFICAYYRKVEYTVPIAAQTAITLYNNVDGVTIVNDVFDGSSDIRMQDLQVCIFPGKNYSAICLFFHRDDRNLFGFVKQFDKLSVEDKLQYVLYILLKGSEEFCFAPSLAETFNNSKNVRLLCQDYNGFPHLGHFSLETLFDETTENIGYNDIPHFLDSEYQINM